MRARSLSEIKVYKKALQMGGEISELLKRPVFGRNFTLKDQLSRSTGRIAPLVAEGYGQLTDRHLAVYLGRARGSVQETIGHLEDAYQKALISKTEYSRYVDSYDHIGRMLTNWINYLQRTDWRDRH
jgi:four helix bundle protein